ncbi:hypothetical protein F5Y18DRAFT_372205 [Xylariaceae sp. FL1019]|nr:hypothetical protein F5Y18DRAFT_372205 [Xylariaceae sp. FL1019]
MLKAKCSTLIGLVDSDEEDRNVFAQSKSAQMAPARKARDAATAKQGPGRKALAEKAQNVVEKATRGRGVKRQATDDIDVPETQQEPGGQPIAKASRGRPKVIKAQRVEEPGDELSEIQIETVAAPAPAKRGRKPKVMPNPIGAALPLDAEIPETQQAEFTVEEPQQVSVMVETSIEEQEEEEDEHPRELPVLSRPGYSSIQRPLPQILSSASRRPVSASDSELHDPALRRRVGELTRRYEVLENKYRTLREIGVEEAERNFDRFKKQTEERAETDKQLITALKAQLAAQTEKAKESGRLRTQLEASQGQNDELRDKVDKLQSSLAESRTETKTLTTKLVAARSAAETASMKVPGSAMKNNHGDKRLIANAEAAAQLAQTKENLYGDLTGLLVCGVKREKDEEIFDCVQTGRNGTLHFKLAVGPDESSDNLDDAQFTYMPQLNGSRDQALIDTLPEYLIEEISFPRLQAAKFYSRVVKALSERPEL